MRHYTAAEQDRLTREMFAHWKLADDDTERRAHRDPDLMARLHRWPIIRGSYRFPPRDCDCPLCPDQNPPQETTP